MLLRNRFPLFVLRDRHLPRGLSCEMSDRPPASAFDLVELARTARRYLPAGTPDCTPAVASLVRRMPNLRQRPTMPSARSIGVGVLLGSIVLVLLWSLFKQNKTLRGLRRSTKKAFSGLSDWFFGDEDDKEEWIEDLRYEDASIVPLLLLSMHQLLFSFTATTSLSTHLSPRARWQWRPSTLAM